MFKNLSIPSSYSLIKKGRIFLLLKGEYKDLLLRKGIEDPETFLNTYGETSPFLKGRTPHFSVSIGDGMRMVIRRYSHGGLLRALTRDLYLFGSRSFQELVLTEEIRSSGIATIQPIGAIYDGALPLFYKAYFLSLEIPDAMDLAHYFLEMGCHPTRETLSEKRRIIRSVAILLRRFHREGFFHRDLQLKNILITEARPLLIDFDRSYRKKTLSLNERIGNLLRLNRSVEKWRRVGLPLTRTDRWRFFQAYAGDDQKIREALKKTLWTNSISFLFHRCGWRLREVIKRSGEKKSSNP